MADYIEDPRIAAAIDDLKSRWPAVGDAADHPLTEWMIKRKTAARRANLFRGATAGLLVALVTVAGFLAGLAAFYTHQRALIALIMGCIVACAVGIAYRLSPVDAARKGHRRNFRSPKDLFFEAGDPGQWEQIRMMPMPFRSVAGIMIGFRHYHVCNRKMPPVKWILIIAAGLAGLVHLDCLYTDPCGFAAFVDRQGGAVHWLALIAGGLFLICAIYSLILNRTFWLNGYFTSISELVLGDEPKAEAYGCGFMLALVFLVFMLMANLSWLAIMADMGKAALVLEISFPAWALIVMIVDRQFKKKNLDPEFEEMVAWFGPKYEELVRQKSCSDNKGILRFFQIHSECGEFSSGGAKCL